MTFTMSSMKIVSFIGTYIYITFQVPPEVILGIYFKTANPLISTEEFPDRVSICHNASRRVIHYQPVPSHHPYMSIRILCNIIEHISFLNYFIIIRTISIMAVQTITGSNPHITVGILKNIIYPVVRGLDVLKYIVPCLSL